jgi:hypothetical protein
MIADETVGGPAVPAKLLQKLPAMLLQWWHQKREGMAGT